MPVDHLFSSPQARALFENEYKRSIESASYSELEALKAEFHAALTVEHNDKLSPARREALLFLNTEIAERQRELEPMHNVGALGFTDPIQTIYMHAEHVTEMQDELAEAKQSGNPAWIEQCERRLHVLNNITAKAEDENAPYQPYYANDAERERAEANESRATYVDRLREMQPKAGESK